MIDIRCFIIDEDTGKKKRKRNLIDENLLLICFINN